MDLERESLLVADMTVEHLNLFFQDLHIAPRPKASNLLSCRDAEHVRPQKIGRCGLVAGLLLVLRLRPRVEERGEGRGLERVLMLEVREAERSRRGGGGSLRDCVHHWEVKMRIAGLM